MIATPLTTLCAPTDRVAPEVKVTLEKPRLAPFASVTPLMTSLDDSDPADCDAPLESVIEARSSVPPEATLVTAVAPGFSTRVARSAPFRRRRRRPMKRPGFR